MLSLRTLANTTTDRNETVKREAHAKYLLTTDPLFSLTVKLWRENKILRELLDDKEKPPIGLVDEELERIRNCPTT